MADRFLVMFCVPPSVVDNWRQTDAAAREPAERKMQEDWRQWMSDHADLKLQLEAAGATKLITSAGVSDHRNDVMLQGFVEAPSQEAAAKAFENHPHLTIPQASIEVTALRPMRGM